MYNFEFHPEAKEELKKLNNSIQILFTKKLKQIQSITIFIMNKMAHISMVEFLVFIKGLDMRKWR